eukprot:9272161-Ditylum_brightwellii.AAC.1
MAASASVTDKMQTLAPLLYKLVLSCAPKAVRMMLHSRLEAEMMCGSWCQWLTYCFQCCQYILKVLVV